jgi:hypothetical protein
MLRCCLISCALVVLLAPPGRAALTQETVLASLPATVEGNIVNKSVSDVTVRLEAVRSSPLGASDGYTGTVAADGSFRFDDVAPGNYRLVAETPFFLRAQVGSHTPEKPGTVLQIKPGEHLKGLALSLVPDPPALCGRVTDADGRPLQLTVEAFGLLETGDGLRASPQQPTKLTDLDGRFLFPNLWPQGRYFLRANGVWYPSSESFSGARIIEPSPASRSGCAADIRIPRRRCHGNRIHGTIQGTLTHSVFQYDVSLFATNPSGALFLADSHPLYQADILDFEEVCAGGYVIIVEDHWGGNWESFASPVFEMKEANITVALLQATQPQIQKLGVTENDTSAPASVNGELRLDGLNWEQACPTHVGQQLGLLREGDRNSIFAALDKEGRFTFENLKPGAYTLNPGSFLHGMVYLKSFLVDGKPAKNRQFSLLPGQSAKVEITMSSDPADAEGHLPATESAPHYLPRGTHPAATLSGKVIGLVAGTAQVKLRAIRFNSGRSLVYETTTAADGLFRFNAVDPGIYVLSTSATDDQYSAYGAKAPSSEGMPITLAAGQHRDGMTLRSYRKSTLCGRVLDAQGKPQSGWQVWAQGRPDPFKGGSPESLKKNAATDEHGYFRIPYVGPNSVLLWAQQGDQITYYPSYITFGDPQGREPGWIDLGPTDSDCSYEIRLVDRQTGTRQSTYHVRGTVQGPLDSTLGDRFYVKLTPENPRLMPAVSAQRIEGDGSFDVSNVWPGGYTLSVTSTYAKFEGPMMCSGRIGSPCYSHLEHVVATLAISVGTADLNDVRPTLQPLAYLTGQILLDGNAPEAERLKKWSWVPSLAKEFRNQAPATASLSLDGHFSMDSLDEGDYNFFINNFWPEYYIQSILVDGKVFEGKRFHLGFGQSAHVIVNLASDGASGVLRNAPGDPPMDPYRDLCQYFREPSTRTVLIPDPLPAGDPGVLEGSYSSDGEEHLAGVPPGRYRMVAFENFKFSNEFDLRHSPGLFHNREFLEKLGQLGQAMEITPKQQFRWTGPVVTEGIQRLLAEIGEPVDPVEN